MDTIDFAYLVMCVLYVCDSRSSFFVRAFDLLCELVLHKLVGNKAFLNLSGGLFFVCLIVVKSGPIAIHVYEFEGGSACGR